MANFAVQAVVAIGLSLLAQALRKDQGGGDFVRDDKPTTLAKRGSFVPFLIGRRRIGPVFAWAGGRNVREEKSGGGKSLGGDEAVTKRTYFEDGWHQVCVGPADKLVRIVQDGGILFDDGLDRDVDPSGTTVSLGNRGSFDWYWGQGGDAGDPDEPPLNPFLADPSRVGVNSRWPHLCYCVWKQKKLGSAPRWPLLDYDVIVKPPDLLANSPAWLGDDVGANPAHTIMQIMTAAWPHGVGMKTENVDREKLEELGVIAAAEGIGVNILAQDGIDAAKKIAEILQDMSIALPQVGRQIVPIAIRPPTAPVPVLGDDELASTRPERNIDLSGNKSERVVFTFKDAENRFRDMDIQVDNDGEATQRGRVKARKVPMNTVISRDVAVVRSDQRQQEEIARVDSYKVRAVRGGRLLFPGMIFDAAGIGRVRVLRKKPLAKSAETDLECVIDNYSVANTGFVPGIPATTLAQIAAAPDDPFDFFELPFGIVGDFVRIGVVRIRAHDQIERASVEGSDDGTTFEFMGNQDDSHTGGTLDEAINAGDDWIIEQGPIITADRDITKALDLSSNDLSWRSGRQLLLIGDEIFFLRNITALGGDKWRLDGLIRGRFDTERLTHPIGSRVWIVDRQTVTPIQSVLIQPGTSLDVKSLPGTFTDTVDPSVVTAVTKTIGGRALKPLPPGNLRGNDFGFGEVIDSYEAGGGVVVEWTNRVKDGDGNAAAELRAGQPIGPAVPPIEGEVVLEVVDVSGPTVVRTETFTGVENSFFYDPDAIAADLGSPASFQLRLRGRDGAFVSADRTVTIERDDPGEEVPFSALVSDAGFAIVDEAGRFIFGDPG